MSKITISTLNVQGLVSNEKRREVFHWPKKKTFSIYMLQEAHCTESLLRFVLLNGAIQLYSVVWQVTK